MASVIVLGIGANSENLPVALSYGLRGRRIGIARNLVIAGATAIATLVPLAIGAGVRGYMATKASDIVAGLILVALGLFNFWEDRRLSRSSPGALASDHDRAGFIGLRETLTLAAALSINNICLGFAGGVAGLGYASVGVSVAAFSVALLWLGEWLSRSAVPKLTRTVGWLNLDGNLLLVAVGVLTMAGA